MEIAICLSQNNADVFLPTLKKKVEKGRRRKQALRSRASTV